MPGACDVGDRARRRHQATDTGGGSDRAPRRPGPGHGSDRGRRARARVRDEGVRGVREPELRRLPLGRDRGAHPQRPGGGGARGTRAAGGSGCEEWLPTRGRRSGAVPAAAGGRHGARRVVRPRRSAPWKATSSRPREPAWCTASACAAPAAGSTLASSSTRRWRPSRETGAAPWAEHARRELRASGATLPPPRPGPSDVLTPQELQVALARRAGQHEPRRRRRPVHQPQDGGAAPLARLPQAGVRSRAGARADRGRAARVTRRGGPRLNSSPASRASRISTASAVDSPSRTAQTRSVSGRSRPRSRPIRRSVGAVTTPSATMPMRASRAVRRHAPREQESRPAGCGEWSEQHVTTRSPRPARPEKVRGSAPNAAPRRAHLGEPAGHRGRPSRCRRSPARPRHPRRWR